MINNRLKKKKKKHYRADTEINESTNVETSAEVDEEKIATESIAEDSERRPTVIEESKPTMIAESGDSRPEEHVVEPNKGDQQQPNYTNRWSLQEHPNRGTTPVRSSPSLGSIPKHKRTSKCSKDELSDLPETWDEECQKHLVDFAER